MNARPLFCLVLLAVASCRKPIPQAAPVKATPTAALVVSAPDGLLFTFADETGAFQTVDTRDRVPAHARKMVRVVDPTEPPLDSENVFVLDLTELERKSPVTTQIMPRARFETQSLAQLVPGESSSLGAGGGADGGANHPTVASPAGTARVVLYGTSWCGACRTARQYFVQNGIAFVDKDVEKDAAAADELRDKATRLGVSADRVPVLDIGGRLLIGFDPARVQRMLESTAI
ncbi:MAG: glutaredoxin domain-containing protein [Deltaproteobacteria bacterium]|nr:glutaredoxin domain-containing protein [Deltaproteobacteria bacterium]